MKLSGNDLSDQSDFRIYQEEPKRENNNPPIKALIDTNIAQAERNLNSMTCEDSNGKLYYLMCDGSLNELPSISPYEVKPLQNSKQRGQSFTLILKDVDSKGEYYEYIWCTQMHNPNSETGQYTKYQFRVSRIKFRFVDGALKVNQTEIDQTAVIEHQSNETVVPWKITFTGNEIFRESGLDFKTLYNSAMNGFINSLSPNENGKDRRKSIQIEQIKAFTEYLKSYFREYFLEIQTQAIAQSTDKISRYEYTVKSTGEKKPQIKFNRAKSYSNKKIVRIASLNGVLAEENESDSITQYCQLMTKPSVIESIFPNLDFIEIFVYEDGNFFIRFAHKQTYRLDSEVNLNVPSSNIYIEYDSIDDILNPSEERTTQMEILFNRLLILLSSFGIQRPKL